MYSWLYRLNTLTTFAIILLVFLCGAASFLDSFNVHNVNANAQVLRVKRFRRQSNGNDEVSLALNVTMDLKSLFTWNTKQVFVFLAAEYETPKNSLNQISLWDHIILDKDHAKLQQEVANEYPLLDQGSHLRGRKVDLVLHWHVMPKTGKMIQDKMPISEFYLPNVYS